LTGISIICAFFTSNLNHFDIILAEFNAFSLVAGRRSLQFKRSSGSREQQGQQISLTIRRAHPLAHRRDALAAIGQQLSGIIIQQQLHAFLAVHGALGAWTRRRSDHHAFVMAIFSCKSFGISISIRVFLNVLMVVFRS